MGLDMYAFATDAKIEAVVDFEIDSETCKKIAYWRKHPNLHGWMENLYRAKGGKDEDFNCTPVVLTAEDLDRLEADVKNKALPHTTGFFFGRSADSEYEEDLTFIAKARAAIADGKTVFYYAWW